MKYASPSLIALLAAGGPYLMADLITVTLWDGSIYRWNLSDSDLVFGGHTFTAGGSGNAPIIERGTTRCVVGLEVDTLAIKLLCGQSVTLGGISMVRAAMNGAFDSASIKLERVFMPTWGDTSPGSVVLFEGEVAGVDPSTTEIDLSVKSDADLLSIAMPAYLCQPGCGHLLYSTGCGLSRAAFTVSGTCTGIPTTTSIPSALSQAADYFTLGVLVMTSGVAAGARRTVRAFSGGTITPSMPLPAAPAAGDTFQVYPGCNRTLGHNYGGTFIMDGDCAVKFSNTARFRGFPWVPRAESGL